MLLMFAYFLMSACIYVYLPPAYVYLFVLTVSYVCLRHLCMLMFIIYLLMGYDISEGIFCWTTKKGKCLVEDLCI
jgi:hypothetical protein